MININASVIGHSLMLNNMAAVEIPTGSIEVDQLAVTFAGDDWTNATKKAATFWQDPGAIYEVEITNGVAVIPASVLARRGIVHVGIYGDLAGGKRITTNEVMFYAPQGAMTSETAPAPTQSVFERAVNDAVTASIDEIDEIIALSAGIEPIELATFQSGYFSTAAVGGTMTLTRTSNAGFTSAILSVSAGDIVTITATGTGTAQHTGATVYAITDSNKTVLEVGAQNAALDNVVLTMPEGAAYIAINNKTADQASPMASKGALDQVGSLVKRVDSGLELARRRLDSIWAYGRVDGSNGKYVPASAKRRRTTSPCGVAEGIFTADARGTDYSFYVFAYRRFGSSIYVGAWDDTNQTWVQGASGFSAVKYYDFSAHPGYKFQLVLCTDNDDYILASDAIDVFFDVSPVNSNVAKINEHERMLGDIAQPAVVNAVTTYHIVPSGSTSRVTMLANAHIKSESVAYSEFGTIYNTAASDAVYYVQVTEDSVLYVDTNHAPCTCRTSSEEPIKDTSKVWTGRISRTMPTPKAPWIVPAGYYIAVGAEDGLAAEEYVDICVAPVGYSLSSAVMDAVRSVIDADYSVAENMERTSDVYAALDAIEAVSGNRMTHTDISANIDDNTPIRAYVIDTSPKRLNFDFQVEDEPFFDKPKVLITATIHGNERGNVLFLIDFVKHLLEDRAYSDIAGQIEWHIIPVVNVWGYNHTMLDSNNNIVWYRTNQTVTMVSNTSVLRGGVRENANGVDLNRDFSDAEGFVATESQTVRDYFLSLDGLIAAIDLHQWWHVNPLPTVVGMASMVPDNQSLYAKYNRCWEKMSAGAKEAEDYIRDIVESFYTRFQMVFLWGSAEQSTTTRSKTARGYFAGVSGNTEHTDHAVAFSSTFESSMNTRFLSGTEVPYHPISLMTGNVFTQRMLAAICRAALEEFV